MMPALPARRSPNVVEDAWLGAKPVPFWLDRADRPKPRPSLAGVCNASLTHGDANGRSRFPAEFDRLQRMGRDNLDDIEKTVARHGIDCHFERTGTLSVATEPYQVHQLADTGGVLLDQAAVRAEVNSPTYLAGVWDHNDNALIDRAALACGLANAAEAAFASSRTPGSRASSAPGR